MSFQPVMPPYNVSDPTATFLNQSCLDFLLIELVPLAYRVTNDLEAAAPPATDPSLPGSGVTPPALAPAAETTDTSHNGGSVGAAAGSSRRMDDEEERDAVFYRLEMLGYRVGQGLVER